MTRSVWMATERIEPRPPLEGDTRADVCVVGAGIAGLSVAYELAVRGVSVVVIDDGPTAGGESGRTTGHLASALDDRVYDLVFRFGARAAGQAVRSHALAISRIEHVSRAEGIACDFRRLDGFLTVPEELGARAEELLERELSAVREVGMPGVSRVDRAPLEGVDTGVCLRFRDQAQFHPIRYMRGLVRAIERLGGRVFNATRAGAIHGGSDAHVRTERGPIVRAGAVAVCTNSPVNERVAIHTKQAAYRTYAVGMSVPRGSVEWMLLWDGFWEGQEWYRYVRLHREEGRDDDLLIVGGEDHKTGQGAATEGDARERYERLENWTRRWFPMVGETLHRWSGQVMEPADDLAFIGRAPGEHGNVYLVTGDSGNGMTHGALAGMLIADLATGRENPYAALYDPGRTPVRGVRDYARENLNVAAQYADWLRAGEARDAGAIGPGCGAVIREGLRKLAVYREPSPGGREVRLSAVCPHMGCVVRWNDGEKSWDCPCHGSRFDPYGRVINGPAGEDLRPEGERR